MKKNKKIVFGILIFLSIIILYLVTRNIIMEEMSEEKKEEIRLDSNSASDIQIYIDKIIKNAINNIPDGKPGPRGSKGPAGPKGDPGGEFTEKGVIRTNLFFTPDNKQNYHYIKLNSKNGFGQSDVNVTNEFSDLNSFRWVMDKNGKIQSIYSPNECLGYSQGDEVSIESCKNNSIWSYDAYNHVIKNVANKCLTIDNDNKNLILKPCYMDNKNDVLSQKKQSWVFY